jgi:hypothetical protein
VTAEEARHLIEVLDLIDESTATSDVLTLKGVLKRIIRSQVVNSSTRQSS